MVVAVVRRVLEVRRLEDPGAMLAHFHGGNGECNAPRRIDVAERGCPETIPESVAQRVRALSQCCGPRTNVARGADQAGRQRLREDPPAMFFIKRDDLG